MQDFTKMNIWKRSLDLSVEIYRITKTFPESEKYGLISQIRRCSTSVPANIAEGAGRRTKKDFINFMNIAVGSLNELFTFIEISFKLLLIKEDTKIKIQSEIIEIRKMIYSFQKNLISDN
ncbi:MAG: four helix bundle protein [Candidatus Dojkabacteria bacterium]